MRSFARDLELSASRLSEILKGAGLSEKRGVDIAKKLKLKLNEKNYWLDLILAGSATNPNVKSFAIKRITKAQKLNRLATLKEAEFSIVADWYHAAILELTQIKGFKNDVNWISEKLGINAVTVQSAIERLKLIKLLRVKNGKFLVNPSAYETFSETPSAAIRKFHRQILAQSLDSIENDDVSDRLMQSMIVAIPKSQLAVFNDQMKTFLQTFWEKMKETEKDELYSLSVQLTPARARRPRSPAH